MPDFVATAMPSASSRTDVHQLVACDDADQANQGAAETGPGREIIGALNPDQHLVAHLMPKPCHYRNRLRLASVLASEICTAAAKARIKNSVPSKEQKSCGGNDTATGKKSPFHAKAHAAIKAGAKRVDPNILRRRRAEPEQRAAIGNCAIADSAPLLLG